jgi:hypothetical protein
MLEIQKFDKFLAKDSFGYGSNQSWRRSHGLYQNTREKAPLVQQYFKIIRSFDIFYRLA